MHDCRLMRNSNHIKWAEKIWNPERPKHIELAISFGMSCEVTEAVAEAVVNKKQCDQYPEVCDEKRLCQLAVGNQSWETRLNYQKHVAEAKSRGLTCGVKENTVNIDSGCPEAIMVKMCTTKQVCFSARLKINGKYVWNTQKKYKKIHS